MNVGELVATLRVNLSQFRKGLQDAQAQVSSSMKNVSGKVSGASSAMTTANITAAQLAQKLEAVGEAGAEMGKEVSKGGKQAAKGVKDVSDSFNELDNNAKRVTWAVRGYLRDTGRIASGIIISQAFYGAINSIQQAGVALFDFNNKLQEAEISFEILLGSAEAAKGFIGELQDFAATTPFDFETARAGAQNLLAAGMAARDVLPTLRDFTDAVALKGANPENMERIVYALGQMMTNETVFGDELRQLTDAGIPAMKILKEEMGLTAKEVRNIGEHGIKSTVAIQALRQGIRKYADGASEKLSDTTRGLTAQIKDFALIIGNALFTPIFEDVRNGLRSVAKSLMVLRNAAREGGAGGVINAMFPPELQNNVRGIIGGLRQIIINVKNTLLAFKPLVQEVGIHFINALSVVVPLIAAVTRTIAGIAQYAMSASPQVRALGAAIAYLMIASLAARSIALLVTAIRMLAVAGPIAKAVGWLGRTLAMLFMRLTPIGRAISIVVAGLMVLAGSSRTVAGWLDLVMKKLSQLGGFTVDQILKPSSDKGTDDWWDSVQEGIKDTSEGIEESGSEASKAKKKVDKWLASFDEVHTIPEKLDDAGKGDGAGGAGAGFVPDLPPLDDLMGDALPKEIRLPELVWPDLDWPTIPPALLKPINIKFDIKPPTWPSAPAFATAWVTSMNSIRAAINSVQVALSGWAAKMPSLLPGLLPSPLLLPAWKRLTQGIQLNWGKMWQGVRTAGLIMGPIVVTIFKGIYASAIKSLKNGLKWMQELWSEHKVAIIATLVVLGSLILAVMTFGLSAVVQGIITFIGVAVGWFARLGPRIIPLIRGFPAWFRTAMSGIPKVVSEFTGKIVSAFSKLPGKIAEALAGLPKTLGNILTRAGEKVAKFLEKVGIDLGKVTTTASRVGTNLGRNTNPSRGAIAGFQSGGIIGKDSIVRVGEKGKREAIVPLQNSTAMAPFAEAVATHMMTAMNNSAMFRSNNTNRTNTDTPATGDVIIKIGEGELGRIAISAINRVQRQAGRNLIRV